MEKKNRIMVSQAKTFQIAKCLILKYIDIHNGRLTMTKIFSIFAIH